MNQLRLRDRWVLPHRLQNRFRHFPVQPNQRHRFRSALRFAPSQSEGGDVYPVLSKRRSHVSDYAGLVIIPQVKHRAIELRFERDAVDAYDARRRAGRKRCR